MRYEPAIDRARLIDAVHDAYGILVQQLTFVPVGFVAACYVAHRRDGGPCFLKLWPALRLGDAAAAWLHASLVLTRALYDRNLLPNVPYPLPTRDGALWANLSGRPFALFPLLRGTALPTRTPVAAPIPFISSTSSSICCVVTWET